MLPSRTTSATATKFDDSRKKRELACGYQNEKSGFSYYFEVLFSPMMMKDGYCTK